MLGVYAVFQMALDPMTWDSVVAIGLWLTGVSGFLGLVVYRRTEAGRTYGVDFQQHPYFAPLGQPNTPEKKTERTADADNLTEIHVHVMCRKAVSLQSCSFRLVDRAFEPRLFRLWRWTKVRASIVYVTNVWDAEHERLGKMHLFGISYRPSPTANINDEGGYTVTYSEPLSILVGSSLRFRVIAHVTDDWSGHLEFTGPAPDGRHAHTYRRIVLKRTGSHIEDCQPE